MRDEPMEVGKDATEMRSTRRERSVRSWSSENELSKVLDKKQSLKAKLSTYTSKPRRVLDRKYNSKLKGYLGHTRAIV